MSTTQEEMYLELGKIFSIGNIADSLYDGINDTWCEDHGYELTDKQRMLAQQIEAWANKISKDSSALLQEAYKIMDDKSPETVDGKSDASEKSR